MQLAWNSRRHSRHCRYIIGGPKTTYDVLSAYLSSLTLQSCQFVLIGRCNVIIDVISQEPETLGTWGPFRKKSGVPKIAKAYVSLRLLQKINPDLHSSQSATTSFGTLVTILALVYIHDLRDSRFYLTHLVCLFEHTALRFFSPVRFIRTCRTTRITTSGRKSIFSRTLCLTLS